jgi:glycosyltransferase involved in cell wall biosynthesis
VDVLVDAWRLAGLGDRAELVIGGTGPESERLALQARGLSNVHLVGFVPDEDLADLYRSARIAVMPTRTGEGFGLMAAEAMACGTPVVATRQGALPEIVWEGVNGMLVPVEDPGAMASAIVDVITDDALHDRLAAGARATDLSWDASCARLDAVLAGVVASAV